jgi:hypothetical protein
VVMMALDAFSFPSTDLFDSIPLWHTNMLTNPESTSKLATFAWRKWLEEGRAACWKWTHNNSEDEKGVVIKIEFPLCWSCMQLRHMKEQTKHRAFYFGCRWRWAVSLMLQFLCLQGKRLGGLNTSLIARQRQKYLPLPTTKPE